MSANQSGSSRDDAGNHDVPVLHPDLNRSAAPEVVWSSPVSTGTGFGAGLREAGSAVSGVQTGAAQHAPNWNRMVYAFESDLLDSALVHWDNDAPALTLEMIKGLKPETPANGENSYAAETLASGLGDLMDDEPELITRLDTASPAAADPAMRHFQPDLSFGSAGPNVVRSDGIEDPRAGWRPTGMVFFETLATPPRGTVYSSSLREAMWNHGNGMQGVDDPAAESGVSQSDRPFFDFPETVMPVPTEDTAEFSSEEVVVRGGNRGGGDGVWFFRLMGRMMLVLLALVGLVALAVASSYIYYIQKRLTNSQTTGRNVTVIIKPGESFRTVIDQMHKDGLLGGFMGLDDRYIMRYLAYAYENSDKVKPGVYKFDSGSDLNEIYDRLISGSKDFKITIPEGKTALEVAKLVGDQYQSFNPERFMELVNDPAFTKELGIDAPGLEGYLYPSTYYYGPGMKEEELIRLMVATFQSKVKGAGLDEKATSDSLTFHQHVIMASLIEREARMDEDRPKIASVIYNRLQQGIPLQIDATVNFALNNWRRLTNADYQVEHPYNTYKFKGLPPGPIASPRIESLTATFEPAVSNNLYYVHQGDGHHAFAETYAQHLANVGRYIREKNASGMGNAPSLEQEATSEEPESDAGIKLETAPADKQPDIAPDNAVEKEAEKPAPAESKGKPEEDKTAPKAKSY